jgi:hypothetical protein
VGGFANLYNQEVYVEPTFYQNLANIGAISTRTSETSTPDHFTLYVTEVNRMRNYNRNGCEALVVKTGQRVPVSTMMVLSSDFSTANHAIYKKYVYNMLFPVNQAKFMKKSNDFYVGFDKCHYQDTLHVKYSNFDQEVIIMGFCTVMALVIHFLPFEFLAMGDQVLTLSEKKSEIRQYNQLRAAKILNVLSSLMDKNYMNINDTTGLMNTCLEYTDRKGVDLVNSTDSRLKDLQKSSFNKK